VTELVFRADPYARSCAATVVAVDERGVVLDRTVFYPMGGGQPGDIGVLSLADGQVLSVVDTVKGDAAGTVCHVLAPGAGAPAVGTAVIAEIDWPRRYRLMRVHTCMHLLSAVLRYPVTGGQVGDGRGRLDFDIPAPTLDKAAITLRLNELIRDGHPVRAEAIEDGELAARPELVKTMAVKPPTGQGKVRLVRIEALDLQPCGGTHVASTGEIGAVTVTRIEKKGRLNRRVIVELDDPNFGLR